MTINFYYPELRKQHPIVSKQSAVQCGVEFSNNTNNRNQSKLWFLLLRVIDGTTTYISNLQPFFIFTAQFHQTIEKNGTKNGKKRNMS